MSAAEREFTPMPKGVPYCVNHTDEHDCPLNRMARRQTEFQESMAVIRRLVTEVEQPHEAEYLARNLQQQVKELTRKFHKGNPLSNLLSKNRLPKTR